MILVVGMARSGLAAAQLLRRHGLPVFASDAGQPAAAAAELEAAGIPFETGGHTRSRFLQAEEIVVSPGVPLSIEPLAEARAHGIPVISELELAFRYLRGDIVAITGANGKTTTTTLIGEILQATGRPVQVGGNIGTAMSTFAESSTPQTINVVEASSFQLDGIRSFRPNVGVLLNITPDHLDRYADFAAYRAAKFRMFENQTAGDAAILNFDDPQVYPPLRPLEARMRLFSRKHEVADGAFLCGGDLCLNGAKVMPAAEVPLRGAHNVENVLAAIAAAGCYQVPLEAMADAIRRFRAVEHRLEFCGRVGGVDFYNDSKATNVDSAIKAVTSFDGNLIVILGGKDKGASYRPLVDAMKGRVKEVLLLGAAAEKIAGEIAGRLPVRRAATLEAAVIQARHSAAPGDVVLLSPACASFDMFENYEHRGRVFKEAVKQLAPDSAGRSEPADTRQ